MFSGLGTAPICVDAETYGYCAGNTGGQYNFDGLFDFQRYDNPDLNPYVVGSAAWRAARGLPPPEAYYPERTMTPTVGAKVADSAIPVAPTASPTAAQPGAVTAPVTLSLGTAAIIGAAILWFAFK